VRFFDFTAQDAQDSRRDLSSAPPLCEWENGLRLLAFHSPDHARAGASLPLTLTWQVSHPPDGQIYHFGHYVLAVDNTLAAQYDGPGFDSLLWQPGDIFIAHVSVDLPEELVPGVYELETGVYAYPQIQDMFLHDGRRRCSLGVVGIK